MMSSTVTSSGISSSFSGLGSLERTSAIIIWLPGRYTSWKSYPCTLTRKKKSDSLQKSDGLRQKVVYRHEQTSKSRSRRDFSRQPKPIDELSGYTTENDRDDNDADGGDYTESFYVITAAQKSSTTATRHEVYANLDIVCPDKPGVHDLELKVDIGSSGSTLPVRIARQMYGEMWQSKVETVPNVKLTAYNGGEIECYGVLKILCRYKESQWRKYKFYVVDVDGHPRVARLRTDARGNDQRYQIECQLSSSCMHCTEDECDLNRGPQEAVP